MAKGGLIHYVCIADAHISSVRQSTSDTLTVVAGRWAFCAFDAKGEGHDWRETEGMTIEAPRSGLPRGRFAQLPVEGRSRYAAARSAGALGGDDPDGSAAPQPDEL